MMEKHEDCFRHAFTKGTLVTKRMGAAWLLVPIHAHRVWLRPETPAHPQAADMEVAARLGDRV